MINQGRVSFLSAPGAGGHARRRRADHGRRPVRRRRGRERRQVERRRADRPGRHRRARRLSLAGSAGASGGRSAIIPQVYPPPPAAQRNSRDFPPRLDRLPPAISEVARRAELGAHNTGDSALPPHCCLDKPRPSWLSQTARSFKGTSIGAAGHTVGEVVFNTALTGYQEILTDPSYCRQIVTLTYPHIGNNGVNDEDVEADEGPCRRPGHQGPAAAARRTSAATLTLRRSTCSAKARWPSPTSTPARLTRVLRSNGRAERLHRDLAAGHERRRRRHRRGRGRGAGRARAWPAWIWPRWSRVDEPYAWTETEWTLGSGYGQQTAADASTSWPTTSASSATSCACWPAAAAASPWCRRRRRPPRCWR